MSLESLLNRIVRDQVTGFTGIVTAVTKYADGYQSVQIEVFVDGKIHQEWVAYSRVTIIE